MERRGLEYFRAVARHGSVTAAAAEMSVTQPAVSKQIRQLEAELAMRLFHRRPDGMALTPAGRALHDLGGDVLARFERAEATLQARFAGKQSFRVACPPTTAFVLMTPFMAATDPAIADLLIVPAADVDDALDRDADLGISTVAPPAHRRSRVVGHLPVAVAGTPERMRERFGDAPAADLELLADDPVLVPMTGVRASIMQATAHLQPPLKVREVAMGFVGQALAANGHGFALATEKVDFELVSLPARVGGRPIEAAVHASWDAQHYAASALEQLAAAFEAWLRPGPRFGLGVPGAQVSPVDAHRAGGATAGGSSIDPA